MLAKFCRLSFVKRSKLFIDGEFLNVFMVEAASILCLGRGLLENVSLLQLLVFRNRCP